MRRNLKAVASEAVFSTDKQKKAVNSSKAQQNREKKMHKGAFNTRISIAENCSGETRRKECKKAFEELLLLLGRLQKGEKKNDEKEKGTRERREEKERTLALGSALSRAEFSFRVAREEDREGERERERKVRARFASESARAQGAETGQTVSE